MRQEPTVLLQDTEQEKNGYGQKLAPIDGGLFWHRFATQRSNPDDYDAFA